ncbi:MAG: metal-dependent transcriptional regulator [Chloroflexia bacterium]
MAETLTPTIEDYLGLIYLMEREGQVPIGARLAERLGVSRPTVSATLRRMARAGLICWNERKEITLTAAGREAAQSLVRRHMLAEWLLREILGLPWHHVHEEAGRLEHHISPEAVDRLQALFEQPSTCPHGNPMPGTEAAQIPALDEVQEGETVAIERIVEEAEEEHDLMAFLEENGLLPGTTVLVVRRQPYNGTMLIEVGGRPLVLGFCVARHIRVRPER